ncbi:unnamed protein product [Victoria cruziana]
MKRVSFPILFLALLLLIFSVAFARELAENKDEKHVRQEVRDAFLPHFPPFRYRSKPHIHLPPCTFCRSHCCNNRCCSSEEEYAEFVKASRVP